MEELDSPCRTQYSSPLSRIPDGNRRRHLETIPNQLSQTGKQEEEAKRRTRPMAAEAEHYDGSEEAEQSRETRVVGGGRDEGGRPSSKKSSSRPR